jgi:hypothetical protein
MAFLYLLARLSFALVHLLVRWRVARLEKRYVRLAADADALLRKSCVRAGNSNSKAPDPFLAARQQHELALLATKRDRVEERYLSGQKFSERFGGFRRGLAGYRGRLVPYLFGLLDVSAVALALNHFEVSVSQVRSLVGM